MAERIYKTTAYEKFDGAPHTLEAYRQKIEGAAPYAIMLDGSFLSTAESGAEISDEIDSTIKWFGWSRSNPVFA